jgi:hypothetical protein
VLADCNPKLGRAAAVGRACQLLEPAHEVTLDPGVDELPPFGLFGSHEQNLSDVEGNRRIAYAPVVAQSELWLRGGYWQQPPRPYRSWPHPMDRLERIAFRLGINDDELRELLRDAIQQRLRENGLAWEKLDRVLEMRQRS